MTQWAELVHPRLVTAWRNGDPMDYADQQTILTAMHLTSACHNSDECLLCRLTNQLSQLVKNQGG